MRKGVCTPGNAIIKLIMPAASGVHRFLQMGCISWVWEKRDRKAFQISNFKRDAALA